MRNKEGKLSVFLIGKGKDVDISGNNKIELPMDNNTHKKDQDLQFIDSYLRDLHLPTSLSEKKHTRLTRYSRHFFIHGGQLWRQDKTGCHQKVIFGSECTHILRETHDKLSHCGFYPTQCTLADCFWWTSFDQDVTWYIKTCHQCQIYSINKVVLPPVIAMPAPLFCKAYIDTMHMPKSHGFLYIVQACCSLSAWPEFHMLRTETGHTLSMFIFEEILCCWGGLEEIVTDNGTPFIATLEWLVQTYHICHICISAYNSQANGVVKWSHHTICDSLIKACNDNITQWPTLMHHVIWADHVTTRKSTSHSPYYMAHGVEPLLPFDVTKAMFMIPDVHQCLDTADLIAICNHQLTKRDDKLASMHKRLLKSRFASIANFEHHFTNTIQDFNFKPGSLVLILNKKVEATSNTKCKPQYFGPMVVVSHSQNGSYHLTEVDGMVSKLKFATFRLILYFPWSLNTIEVTQFVNPEDIASVAPVEEE